MKRRKVGKEQKQVIELLRRREWTDEDLASLLRVRAMTIRRWRQGQNVPSRIYREQIALLLKQEG